MRQLIRQLVRVEAVAVVVIAWVAGALLDGGMGRGSRSARGRGSCSRAQAVLNSTKTRVVTARMPWARTTGTGKFRSGGTLRFLVSDEPG